MRKDEYGYKKREQNKKDHIKRIKKNVEKKIYFFLPELNEAEVKIADEQYQSQMDDLIRDLMFEYRKDKDHKIARNYLSGFISDGNSEGKWYLNVPSPILEFKREQPYRTERTHNITRMLNEWEQTWIEYLNSRPATNINNVDLDILPAVLISAAFYGGLCIPDAISALMTQLRFMSKPLIISKNRVWIDLVFDSKTQPRNVVLFGKRRTLKRWYPDPISLAWINNFLAHRPAYYEDDDIDIGSSWDLIKSYMKRISFLGGNVTGSFSEFCKSSVGVAEKYSDINQANIEYLVGINPSVSLPQGFYNSIVKNTNYKTLKLQSIPKHKKPELKQKSSKDLHKSDHNYGALISRIHRSLNPSLFNGKKNTKTNAKNELDLILESNLPEAILILVSWLFYLLDSKPGLKVSSVYRYFSAIGKGWINGTMGIDIYALDESGFEQLYKVILDSDKDEDTRNFKAARFDQFHEYGHRYFDLEYMSFSLTNNTYKGARFVRSGFISEQLFKVFCKSIDVSGITGLHVKNGLKLLYILSFRLGLRRGELLKLRLKDIEESNHSYIYILNNIYGNNKSNSSTRKIPALLFLTTEEKELFKTYLAERKILTSFKTKALVFSLPETHYTPLKGSWVSSIAKELLTNISGLPIVFHDLRDSALSRLQIILEEDKELIRFITPYSNHQIKRIQNELGGFDEYQNKRDMYWSLAGFAGHLTPETSFSNYLHFTDIISANKLRKSSLAVSLNVVREISGLSSHMITRLCNKKELDVNALRLLDFNGPLISSIIKYSDQIVPSIVDENVDYVCLPKKQITVELCFAVLKEAEYGATKIELCNKFDIDEYHLNNWIKSAKSLAELKTTKNKKRLFLDNESPKKVLLLPSKPPSNSELEDANEALETMRELYKKNDKRIKWCIEYYLSTTNMSSSAIKFNNPADFRRFIKLMSKVFPLKRWHFHFEEIESNKNKDYLGAWKIASMKIEFKQLNSTVKRKTKFPNGQVKAYLSHPNESKLMDSYKGKKIIEKYSSNTIRYVFHMIAIMVGIIPEVE